jgi:hypothetical protein
MISSTVLLFFQSRPESSSCRFQVLFFRLKVVGRPDYDYVFWIAIEVTGVSACSN